MAQKKIIAKIKKEGQPSNCATKRLAGEQPEVKGGVPYFASLLSRYTAALVMRAHGKSRPTEVM